MLTDMDTIDLMSDTLVLYGGGIDLLTLGLEELRDSKRFTAAHAAILTERRGWSPKHTDYMEPTVLVDDDVMYGLATQGLAEALKYMRACVQCPGTGLAPSPMVDFWWHMLLADTKAYRELCHRLGGFVHHRPTRVSERTTRGHSNYEAVFAAMRLAGVEPDEGLWLSKKTHCDPCGGKKGCETNCNNPAHQLASPECRACSDDGGVLDHSCTKCSDCLDQVPERKLATV